MKGLHLRVSMPQTGSSVLFFAGLGHRQQDANVAPLVIKTPLAIATIGHRQLQVEGSPSPRRAALPISREARQPMRIPFTRRPGLHQSAQSNVQRAAISPERNWGDQGLFDAHAPGKKRRVARDRTRHRSRSMARGDPQRQDGGIDKAAINADGCGGDAARQGESRLRGYFPVKADRKRRDFGDDC
jgi:hypothetical protein